MTETKKAPTVAAEIEGTVLTLTFANGEVLSLNYTTLSAAMAQAAILHGLKQKLVDAAAISRNPDTGASATADDKYNAVLEVYNRITSPDGTWNKLRGDGTGGASTGGLLLRAMAALTGKTLEETQAILDECSDDEVKALRASPAVKSKMDELRPPKVSKLDVNAIMGKFGV